MTEVQRAVALYLLVDRHGRVLLQERDSEAPRYADQWSVPGGGIEAGESPLQAVHRELTEETEVVLPDGELVAWRAERREVPGLGLVDYHLFTAAVELTDADITCHEGRQIVFVGPERFATLDLTGSATEILENFVRSERYARLVGR
ncbi:NUDIX domain-containing protein [Nocardioides alcanivorans]|uniref:NUDIX domain-containing protein n=1 Tax=Nocardioides alcanivorans TaxID=2897352 RepID=UPI001F37A131|nr:NUDIX domain-containing protein [Nocardioides alcanivorans]